MYGNERHIYQKQSQTAFNSLSNEMLELMNFHEFLSQELFAMSFQFSDHGTLTADQHNDLAILRELFFDIRSSLNENEGKTDEFNVWYTTIMDYKGC